MGLVDRRYERYTNEIGALKERALYEVGQLTLVTHWTNSGSALLKSPPGPARVAAVQILSQGQLISHHADTYSMVYQ